MGLFDTISHVARKVGTGVQRGIGALAHGIRRIADITKPVVMGVGRFVQHHHAPLAMIAKGVGDMSGNETLRNVGNLAMSASGAYATRQRLDAFNASRPHQQ